MDSLAYDVARHLLADPVSADTNGPDEEAQRAQLEAANAESRMMGAVFGTFIAIIVAIFVAILSYTLYFRRRVALIIMRPGSDEVEVKYKYFKYWWDKTPVWKHMIKYASQYTAGREDTLQPDVYRLLEERFHVFQSYLICKPAPHGGGMTVAPGEIEHESDSEEEGKGGAHLGETLDPELVRPWLGEALEFYGEASDAPVLVYCLGSTSIHRNVIDMRKLDQSRIIGFQLDPKTDAELTMSRWKALHKVRLGVRLAGRTNSLLMAMRNTPKSAERPQP